MKYLLLFFSVTLSATLGAQGLVDSLTSDQPPESQDNTLITETVQNFSQNRKIFIISNSNSSYNPGDYISLIFQSQLVARALVAKIVSDSAGIKITKIYSEKLWQEIQKEQQVQVLRGDDSYYIASLKNEKKEVQTDDPSTLIDEDDLYSETSLEDGELEINDNKKRIIKPDNLLGATIGALNVNINGTQAQFHTTGFFARQIGDNIWIEGQVGMSPISDYPGAGIDTNFFTLTGRLKYIFNAPFYSYLLPYVGVQYHYPVSPGAGTGENISEEQKQSELEKVENLRQLNIAMGVTILKRLVPGWFLRGDFGTDGFYAGLCLEF